MLIKISICIKADIIIYVETLYTCLNLPPATAKKICDLLNQYPLKKRLSYIIK